ncbi:MAG TPA: hypothetical protein VFU05_12625 [Cyclobacteriaceae bacterium]|nr:hypothetical protein [Cyclobacteriaceae bacterium]
MPKISFIIVFLIASVTQAQHQKKVNILFLGNSLTYANNLPELVKQVAASDSVEMNYRSICFPNYALIDHWKDGNAQKEIESDKYNFVIVQQGPSSQEEGRAYLIEWGLKFDSLCDKHHSKLVSYMVWPSKERSLDFQGVYDSYKLLADSAKAIFSPAGQAWQVLWQENPEFKLYSEDNFHPNYRGSLLAALVIYGSVMKKKNFYNIKISDSRLTDPDFNVLRQAAQKSLAGKEKERKKKGKKA